jgi:hypothetical protein
MSPSPADRYEHLLTLLTEEATALEQQISGHDEP